MKRCAVCLTFVLVAAALRADELEKFRQREQLLAQKWSRDVAAAIEIASKQVRTDPRGARETLESTLGALKAANGINDTVRADLMRQLSANLARVPANATAPQPKSLTPPRPAPGGNFAPGGGGTALPGTFGGGPAPSGSAPPGSGSYDAAKSFIDKNKATLGQAANANDRRNIGFSGALQGVDKSAVPAGDRDMTFSPDHAKIVAARAVKLNPKEEATMNALSSTIDGDFSGMTFRQALEVITQKSGLLIIPDAQSLKDAMVDYDDPVNFKVAAKIQVRTALRKILGDRGLSYTINEGTVNVVTQARARESTVVRIYPITDLVTPIQPVPQVVPGPFGPTYLPPNTFPQGTPGIGTFQQAQGQAIVDMIKTSVDPTYWAPNGPGSVAFEPITGSLVVRASAEIHFMLGGTLGVGRR